MILCFVLIVSCQNTQNEEGFIQKYGHSNFDLFKNTWIYLRGWDNEGNPIVFFHFEDDDCGAPFIIQTDINGLPIGLDDKLRVMHCSPDTTSLLNLVKDNPLDTAKILNLIKEYSKYNIRLLSVDDNGTVKVNVDAISTPDLIRVVDTSYLTEYQRKNWTNVKDNWYMEEN